MCSKYVSSHAYFTWGVHGFQEKAAGEMMRWAWKKKVRCNLTVKHCLFKNSDWVWTRQSTCTLCSLKCYSKTRLHKYITYPWLISSYLLLTLSNYFPVNNLFISSWTTKHLLKSVSMSSIDQPLIIPLTFNNYKDTIIYS